MNEVNSVTSFNTDKLKNNRWIRAAIPALLIHVSVGSVYCWSIIKDQIAEEIGANSFQIGWAFSLAIFFLGMSAAFAGKLVEKNIHASSTLALIFFYVGLCGTGFTVNHVRGHAALILIYICYGVIMGIGLGIGYLTPVKTLMIWFSDNKGLATGISIMGFGLAKAIAAPIMAFALERIKVGDMLIAFSFFYLFLMIIAHKLLKKPDDWVEPEDKYGFNAFLMFKDRQFLSIWMMFFLNIHCGLMIISLEKQFLSNMITASVSMIAIVPAVTAFFNATGRLGYSTLSDKLQERNSVYTIIFFSSTLVSTVTAMCSKTLGQNLAPAILILFLIIVNAGYGGGFSTLPALISERYGMVNVSQIHGVALSAWAVAGLTGNNMSEIIIRYTNDYKYIVFGASILYFVAMNIAVLLVGDKSDWDR